MINFDLHIHSQFSSDGELTVAEITNLCIARGITLFSITDHNSTKAVGETAEIATEKKAGFIPGIEIDCNHEGTDLHLLGYNIDWESPDFTKLEEDVSQKVMNSFDEMICKINRSGFVIDSASVLSEADGKLPTGELIAEVMLSDKKYYTPLLQPYMEGGTRSDMPYINFYLDYFAQGKPAFVPIEYMSFTNAIELIRDNGGIPIVAHPGLNLTGKEQTAEQLLKKGASGLEVFNNYHTIEQIDYFASLVINRDCIMTCGSDFHGKTKPLIQIGQFKSDKKFKEYLIHSIQKLRAD